MLICMPDSRFDHIVIGSGALGSAAAYWLSRKTENARVLVCEQFYAGHPWGSSDDHSRIIRHSYHSPVYTALTPSAYDTWAEVEEHSGTQLVLRTGGLDLACEDTPGYALLETYRRSLEAAGIPYDRVEADAIRARWPQWTVTPDVRGIFQADGGLVDIRRATAAHVRLAVEQGVTVLSDCQVHEVRSLRNGVEILTSAGVFSAGSLTVCAGSWAGPLLTSLGCSFTITLTQEQVQYFAAPNLDLFRPDRFPIWVWHGDQDFYGFPVYGEPAVKAARDMTGWVVTPETRSFEPSPAEVEYVRAFLRRRLPKAVGPVHLAKTCVYDLPRDRDLVIGPVPGHPRVHIAIGAGHAGKFASLIGRILADLATDGRTSYPISAFRADRPGLAPTAPQRYRLGGSAAASAVAADAATRALEVT
jgi:monomeric sarcosine oxidase